MISFKTQWSFVISKFFRKIFYIYHFQSHLNQPQKWGPLWQDWARASASWESPSEAQPSTTCPPWNRRHLLAPSRPVCPTLSGEFDVPCSRWRPPSSLRTWSTRLPRRSTTVSQEKLRVLLTRSPRWSNCVDCWESPPWFHHLTSIIVKCYIS